MSILQITNASYSRILHWFIHVVDNINVKTNLICNESQFQQTNRVKTQMHCFICKDRQVSHLMNFFLHQANQTLLNQLIILNFVILY